MPVVFRAGLNFFGQASVTENEPFRKIGSADFTAISQHDQSRGKKKNRARLCGPGFISIGEICTKIIYQVSKTFPKREKMGMEVNQKSYGESEGMGTFPAVSARFRLANPAGSSVRPHSRFRKKTALKPFFRHLSRHFPPIPGGVGLPNVFSFFPPLVCRTFLRKIFFPIPSESPGLEKIPQFSPTKDFFWQKRKKFSIFLAFRTENRPPCLVVKNTNAILI